MGTVTHLLRWLWEKACKHDNIKPEPGRHVFTKSNPWVPIYNKHLTRHRYVKEQQTRRLAPTPNNWNRF